MPVQFGDFMLDDSRRQLFAGGEPVHLSPKAFQLLSILIQERPRAISKNDLQERLWPDTFVTEGNLSGVVAELRSALGDDAREPRFIRTLYGFGYSFAAPIDDLAPANSQEAAEVASESRKRFVGGIRWTSAGIGVLLGAAGIVLILSLRSMTGSGATATQFTPIDSLAVLPLANLSGDPQQQYFADGMTEELITQLAQIGALRVISRASVMEYRDTQKNASKIAHELHVRALVTGSVLRSATRVRITVQLIDPETSSSIWADQYERELGDVLALQNEVARSIEERIKVKITPKVASRLAAVRSVDPRAYELFLKGRFYSAKNTPDGLNRGLSYFEDAARRDPHYAQAFAGIAYCYNEMGHFQILPPQDAFPSARKAAEKALEFDPGNADAHMSLAWAKADYEWDWPSAEHEFRTAIRLNPNDATCHNQYAIHLAAQRRDVEAIAEANRGVNLDPVSPVSLTGLSWILYLTRRYDASLGHYQRTLEIDSDRVQGLEGVADLYEAMGDHVRAFEAYQRWAAAAGLPHQTIMELDRAFHSYGMSGYWQKRLQMEKDEESEEGETWPYRMAALNARVGNREEAISWLQRAYAERNNRLIFLAVDPVFDGVRSDPRVVQILRGVGTVS